MPAVLMSTVGIKFITCESRVHETAVYLENLHRKRSKHKRYAVRQSYSQLTTQELAPK